MSSKPIARALVGGGLGAMTVLAAHAQTLSNADLVAALRQGGYVLVMRHASSPAAVPDEKNARPDNVKRERQLDEAGRAAAAAMGEAIRRLKISIGEVLASPTYRTIETVRMAGLGSPRTHAELGDRGRSMQGVTAVEGRWLQQRASQRPAAGNTLIVTHSPNIASAFGRAAADVDEGETLVFRPDGAGGATMVARVRIDEWARLAP
jgi:phosphohistidine phosphatase SixA